MRAIESTAAQIAGLVGWLLLVSLAATLGAVASADSQSFYGALDLPSWAPPAWLFGPVWTVLYILMGVAAWLVWRERGFRGARGALLVFVAQLAANALWTWLFFAWRLGGIAFAEIVLLGLLIAAMIAAFRRISPVAAALLLPYLAWVGFAAALCWAAWQRNPAAL